MAEPLPEGMAALLPAARARLDQRMAPIGPEGLAVAMQRAWDAGVPQPQAVTIAEWTRLLVVYPAAEVLSAFEELAKAYRWPDPPKLADVMRYLTPALERLHSWRRVLTKAEMRAKLDDKARADEEARNKRHAAWMADRLSAMTPEQRAEAEAAMERVRNGASVSDLLAQRSQPRDTEAPR